MAQVNTIGAATSLASTAQQPTQELGEQEFLNLLMTQLGNQDPLNPMQSADFAEQVASMNQVKQLMGANERLDQLMLGMTSMNNQSAVQLVGKEVIAKGDSFSHVEGSTQEMHFDLPQDADRVTVTIRDSEGREVRTIDAFDKSSGMQSIEWNGLKNDLTEVPPGDFTFDIQAEDANGDPIEVTTYVRGTVDELRFDNGFPMLVVGGAEITLDQILRVFDADDLAPAPSEPAGLDPDGAPDVNPTVSEAQSWVAYPNQTLQTP